MRAALAACLLAAPALADAPALPRFVDETAASGITSVFSGDWDFMVGGGVSSFDCSGDGLPDLIFAGGEGPATLYRNDSAPGGALRFTPVPSGAELTRVTGAYPLDIDSDGIADLVMLRSGEDVVMRGLGDCRFTRANEDWGFQGGDDWSTAFAATWEEGADWPTLAVGTYIDRHEDAFPWGSCTDNLLYRPGDTGFAPPLPLTPGHCALSMLFTDWNGSGRPALRVSNDREYYTGGQEQLWRIDPGQAPRLFTVDDGWQPLRIWGMGIGSADLTGDGLPDYVLSSMADTKLQVLAGDGTEPRYADLAFPLGATAHRPYIGDDIRPSTGWHVAVEDVNNDGRFDIFIAKGNVDAMPDFAAEDPNNLLLQRADGTFEEAGDRAGVASVLTARGAVVTDLNADGWPDIVVANRRAGAEVWRNTGTGADANWIAIDLRQDGPNRNAIGAVIELRTEGGTIRREVTAGGGHLSGHLGAWHFGLGFAASAEVRITWPDGTQGDWAPRAAGRRHLIEQDAD